MDDAPLRRQPRAGERWTVRHRLPDGAATDVIGWIDVCTPARWTLTDLDGKVHLIDPGTIVVARRAPAAAGGPPPSRTSPADLQHAAVGGWIARSEPLGDWVLRSGGGFTGRANSCLAVGDPGLAMADAAARVVAWSKAESIAPLVQAIQGSAEEAALLTLGWRPAYVPTVVLACRLSDLLGAWLPSDDPIGTGIRLDEHLQDTWLAAYHRSRPNDCDPAVLRAILNGHPPRAFAGYARSGAAPAEGEQFGAIARGHVSKGWAGFAAVWTAPELRRRGIATALLRTLGHWAARRGARNGYLQVATGNAAAIDAYSRLGFSRHHAYGYLEPPPC